MVVLRFAKNITLDQISVEVLRGRGELSNIELNEDVLTDVFDLPTWLSIKKAVCSRVSIKVAWTALKTTPVKIVSVFLIFFRFSIVIF